jgi:hypothetical protein
MSSLALVADAFGQRNMKKCGCGNQVPNAIFVLYERKPDMTGE